MDMSLNDIFKVVFMGMIGLLFWLYRKNAFDLDAIKTDLAVIKEVLDRISGDHDKVVVLADRQNRVIKDIDALGKKLRNSGREIS